MAVETAVPATSAAPVAQGVMVANPAVTSIASPPCWPVASVDFARNVGTRRRRRGIAPCAHVVLAVQVVAIHARTVLIAGVQLAVVTLARSNMQATFHLTKTLAVWLPSGSRGKWQ